MSSASEPAGAARVLIVEDSAEVAEALKLVMESAGHAVRTAGSVADAVAAAAGEPVDVLLLDLTLPDGDGLDVLRGLTRAGNRPEHVIALTGRDEEDVRDRCLAQGCGEVMIKPVPIRKLLARVNELIGVR